MAHDIGSRFVWIWAPFASCRRGVECYLTVGVLDWNGKSTISLHWINILSNIPKIVNVDLLLMWWWSTQLHAFYNFMTLSLFPTFQACTAVVVRSVGARNDSPGSAWRTWYRSGYKMYDAPHALIKLLNTQTEDCFSWTNHVRALGYIGRPATFHDIYPHVVQVRPRTIALCIELLYCSYYQSVAAAMQKNADDFSNICKH